MRFAAEGQNGPKEAVLEQTFQVENFGNKKIFICIHIHITVDQNCLNFQGAIHHQCGATITVLLLHRGHGCRVRPQHPLYCPQHWLWRTERYQLPVEGSSEEDGCVPSAQGRV